MLPNRPDLPLRVSLSSESELKLGRNFNGWIRFCPNESFCSFSFLAKQLDNGKFDEQKQSVEHLSLKTRTIPGAMRGSAQWATGRLHGVPVPRTKRIVSDAARDGDEVAVLELLRMGSYPNSRCPRDGFTPLIAAVYLRHWGIIEMLLAHP